MSANASRSGPAKSRSKSADTKTTRASRTVHMTVEGAFLTEQARRLLLSDCPAAAWRLLTKGLVGDGIEKAAIAILDGRQKLVGDSNAGIGLEDEDPAVFKKYMQEVRFIYAGRVRLDGAWYVPRAEVIDFGPGDIPEVRMGVGVVERVELLDHGKTLQILRGFVRSRVAFYAREGEKLVNVTRSKTMPLKSVKVGAKIFLIFEPVSEPPFWWDEVRDPAAALEQFFAAGREIGEESWTARFGKQAREGGEDDDGDGEDDGGGDEGTREVLERTGQFRVERVTKSKDPEVQREVDEAREALEFANWNRKISDLRERILAQAAGDLFDLTVEGMEKPLRVPRAPFERWSLENTTLGHLAPAWEMVSPSGLKMVNDDPNHSDWMIGAGLEPGEAAYKGPVHDASMEARFAIQERYGDFECAVLVDGGPVRGIVGEEIAVLTDLHPDKIDAVLRSKAVITQAGGQLAHLSQVAGEHKISVLRVPDAVQRFPPGTELSVYPESGAIMVRSTARERAWKSLRESSEKEVDDGDTEE